MWGSGDGALKCCFVFSTRLQLGEQCQSRHWNSWFHRGRLKRLQAQSHWGRSELTHEFFNKTPKLSAWVKGGFMGCEKSGSRHFIRSSNGKRITLRETNGSGQGWRQWADYHGVMCSCLRAPWMGLFLSKKDEEGRCWSTTHLCSHSPSIFGALRQFKKPRNSPKLLPSAVQLGISSPLQLMDLLGLDAGLAEPTWHITVSTAHPCPQL